MKPSLRTKLDQLAARLDELNGLLGSPDVTANLDRYRALTKEHSDITPVVARFREFGLAEADLATAMELANDPAMRDFAAEERASAEARIADLERELQAALLPKDPNDDRNVIVEIRAGTGGDESALFAGSLLRMYGRYAKRHRWKTEIASASPSELGGYKEAIVRIVGQGAYSKLKFESGGHRVQRVPETEAQGRIHTSACTVAVIPEADRSPTSRSVPRIRDGHLPLLGRGRPAREQDLLRRAHHAPAHRDGRPKPGRALQHRNRATALAVLARVGRPRPAGARARGRRTGSRRSARATAANASARTISRRTA